MGKFIKGKLYKDLKEYGRGVDIIKKDTPIALRPLLKQLLIDVILDSSTKNISASIEKAKKKLYELQYHDLLITKQISRELDEYKVLPQHVKAMKYSNTHLNTNFSRMNYKGGLLHVKIKESKYPFTDCIMLTEDMELPREFEVDYNKYFELFIKNKFCLFLDKLKAILNKNMTLDIF